MGSPKICTHVCVLGSLLVIRTYIGSTDVVLVLVHKVCTYGVHTILGR